MNAVAEILRGLDAAGAELRACCDKLNESDARHAVETSNNIAYLVNGNWIVGPAIPADFSGWVIRRAWEGKACKWWFEGGQHFTAQPKPNDDCARSIYADHVVGYTLD